jgi:predicted negative regulator of RcsB-dependent stress response
MARLTRHELETDEVLETAKEGVHWVQEHRQDVVRAGGVVLAVAAVVAGIVGFVVWRRSAAGDVVSQAMSVADAPIAGEAPDTVKETFPSKEARDAKVAELLEKASKDYSGTPAGRAAMLDRASALVAKGDAKGAWALLEKAAAAPGLVGAYAEYDLILVGPAAGKSKETVERINRHLSAANPPIPKDVLLLSLGELHDREGKSAEARAAYQRLVSEFPDSPLRFQAQQKLSQI